MSRNEEFGAGYLHEERTIDGKPHHLVGWHMTDNPDFKHKPRYTPEDTVGAGADKGSLFYTTSPKEWGAKNYRRPYAAEVWAKGKPEGYDLEGDQWDEGMHHLRSGQFKVGAVMPEEQAQKQSPITETPGHYGPTVNHTLTALHYSARHPGAPVTVDRGGKRTTVRYRRAVK